MKILITGGAGCLGGNLIERYLPQGHDIVVIDNFSTGKREVVPEMPGLHVIEGSVANEFLINDIFKMFQPQIVIHSAASYKDPSNWVEDTNTNVIGSINVAKAALENGVDKIINFQTALCYGRPTRIPIPIDSLTAPFTSYGISKTAGEAYILNSGIQAVSLRLANICGPRLAIGPIPTFYTRLKENKSCFCSDSIRDFLDMEDFLSLIDVLLTSNNVTGVYNVSTGVGNSIKDVYDEVAAFLGIVPPDVPIKPVGKDDVPSVILDSSETCKTFAWQPRYNFKQIIRRQLEWYEKYGVSDIYSHLSIPK